MPKTTDIERALLWKRAAGIDPTLKGFDRHLRRLTPLELVPQPYTRDRFFRAVAEQRAILFDNFPLRRSMGRYFRRTRPTAESLKGLFGKSLTTLVKLGPAQRRAYWRVHEVIDRWQETRGVLSANDIHYRNLGLDEKFDCSAITRFNILPRASELLQELEVATMLLGTPGAMSDSHSDDPDGFNHCVTGAKLWLMWDRREGQRRGLQDTEYDLVYERARFDLGTFTRLQSARWLIVAAGHTLFMPGHLTHKVLTLEHYAGISGFYVTFANCLTSLTRWKVRGATMVQDEAWREIADETRRQLSAVLNAGAGQRASWGVDYMLAGRRHWESEHTAAEKNRVLSDLTFRRLAADYGLNAPRFVRH